VEHLLSTGLCGSAGLPMMIWWLVSVGGGLSDFFKYEFTIFPVPKTPNDTPVATKEGSSIGKSET